MEEVPHGDHHLPRRLLGLDPKEPVAIFRAAVDVAECSVVGHILCYKADLVDGVMVEAVLGLR